MSKVEIRPSQIEGTGLFATCDIKASEVIYAFPAGKRIQAAGLEEIATEDRKWANQIDDELYEIIESPARFANHSCHPNVFERDHAGWALRDIRKGEELTIDYATIAWSGKAFECNCGAINCRGIFHSE